MRAQYSWNDLAVFLAAAREGGASAAARTLRMHHATASRHISHLERQLGVRLFERSTRGMALTSAGEELMTHVLSIEEEIDAIGRKVAGRDVRVEGTVRVSTVDDLALSVMPALVAAFRRDHPAVTVNIDVQTGHADLTRREADVAIRFGRPPDDPGAVRRKIADVSGNLYASEDYLRAHPLPASLDDLRGHEIVRGGERLARLPMEEFWNRYGAPSRIAMQSDSMLAQLAAVKAGVGIGWISYFMVEAGGALKRVPIEAPDIRVGLWMVIHADLREVARVRTFADFAWDYLTAMRDRFERQP